VCGSVVSLREVTRMPARFRHVLLLLCVRSAKRAGRGAFLMSPSPETGYATMRRSLTPVRATTPRAVDEVMPPTKMPERFRR